MPGSTSVPGFAPVRVSSRLEILRLRQVDLIEPGDLSAVRLRSEVDHRVKMVHWYIALVAVMFFVWCAIMLWSSHGNLSFIPPMLLLFSSASLLIQTVSRLRGTKMALGTSFLVSCGAFLIGLGLTFAAHQQEQLRYIWVGLLATIPLIILIDVVRSRSGVVKIDLPDGVALRLSEADLSRVTISWTPDQNDLSLHDLPRDRFISGADVAVAFRKLYPQSVKRRLVPLVLTWNAIAENAYSLLGTLGGLGGLLHALEEFRRANDGRVVIARLPVIYLVALDLALADHPRRPTDVDDLRERALDASEIARQAEKLDVQFAPDQGSGAPP